MANKYLLSRIFLALTIPVALLYASSHTAAAATQFNIIGPAGSVRFGTSVTVLPNGNIVITDPSYNGGLGINVGAVYLYNGATGALISMLTGMTASDQVGSGGVTVLSNGNYVVRSPYWNNGSTVDAGAVTWGSSVSGASGVISAANSLVGSTADDRIGSSSTIALANGNYVTYSTYWDNGANADAGAVTWGNGATGTMGVVSAANSLVGSAAGDTVGSSGVKALPGGNYVVRSPFWDNGAINSAGAVTWGNGAGGISGVISAANSLVGSTAGDNIGMQGITILGNGNYVVRSPFWDNLGVSSAGAVTWGNGASGASGIVSAANSLVGNKAGDRVGISDITALSNGNYVVASSFWSNAANTAAGAVTWGNGATGTTGVVSIVNSLVGSIANDQVGNNGVIALNNGNYVVCSAYWDNAAITDAGAVTWGNGTGGVTGAVSAANSLVGSTANDYVGSTPALPLNNGNYVVRSSYWDNASIVDAGAVTWGNGTSGTSGAVSISNSLVGVTNSDRIGFPGITALSNGNYVVASAYWDNAAVINAGAVTWGNGLSGTSGAVSTSNSLVGSTTNDNVGMGSMVILNNGNYLVCSPYWDNSAVLDAGAVTWRNGASGTGDVVSTANSLVGSTASDQVGSLGATVLSNNNYVVRSHVWDNSGIADAGAVTWGSGTSGVSGAVSPANSLVGSTANDQVGSEGVTALNNGNYVVLSSYWDNAGYVNAGAATWGNGESGVSGVISAANSLVGSTANDLLGDGGLTKLSNGDYVLYTPFWQNGAVNDAGAITWGFGMSGVVGPVDGNNSVLGATIGGGQVMKFAYDEQNRQLVVGRPYDNIVTLFKLPYVFLPLLVK